MYTLEKKQHFPIKLPLLNPYKPLGDGYVPKIFQIASYLSKISEHSRSCFFMEHASDEDKQWLARNEALLTQMNRSTQLLHEEDDTFFYTDAFLFNGGVVANVFPYKSNFSHHIASLSNYVMGLPDDDSARELFGKEGYELFLRNIPKTFEIWPKILSNAAIEDEDKAAFTNAACILFEFMVDRATFSRLNSNAAEHNQLLKKQILCYYKYLQGKRIYLPYALQKKVYDFSMLEL